MSAGNNHVKHRRVGLTDAQNSVLDFYDQMLAAD